MNAVELIQASTRTGWHKGSEVELATWNVLLDGKVIGRVARAEITHERKTKGNRYVNARWSSLGWRRADKDGRYWREVTSRRDGIRELLYDAGLSRAEATELARIAKVRRP